ncbi:MAG: sensor histidine kinase [Candidatus Binatia bacterium]
MNDTEQPTDQLLILTAHLNKTRDRILEMWRAAVKQDPQLTNATTLSSAQFYDHIPAVLDAFERTLAASKYSDVVEAEEVQKEVAAGHGLNRWHHGYNQQEVMREWGHLHVCLVGELEAYDAAHPELPKEVMAFARLTLASLCSDGVNESASRYARLQQVEAAGRVRDLEQAIAQLKEVERQRADAWREAAHDLRGNLGVVKNVTEVLNDERVPESERTEFRMMLQQGITSLHALLEDLIVLSRLEAGHDQRKISPFDAGLMLRDLCAAMKPMANERNLFLESEGPDSFIVEGDDVKTQRIAQNLLLNAMKYTEQGGVKVGWGEVAPQSYERWRWMLYVEDTGPGFENGAATPLAQVIKKSTEEAQAVEEHAAEAGQDSTFVAPAPVLPSESPHRPDYQAPGEGIGLSIVKKLCELLDASLEFETERGKGSTFRVIFPRSYEG